MSSMCRTAGLTVRVDAADGSWTSFAREACAGQHLTTGPADVEVHVDGSSHTPPPGGSILTRGVTADGRTVYLADACGSGLDLEVTPAEGRLRVVARPRRTWRHRVLAAAAPGRDILLRRAALIQYPALWWAGTRGLVPLHVSAARVSGAGLVLAGPGGVGKSTLLQTLDDVGDVAVSDNLCVAGPYTIHGLLEPRRLASGSLRRDWRQRGRTEVARSTVATGRRMPHGRREIPWEERLESLIPQRIVVLRRGRAAVPMVRAIAPAEAARELITGTYAAGELRRYWAFAATLALGTGLGPSHPPVVGVSEELASGIPCFVAELPERPGTRLRDLAGLIDGLPEAALDVSRRAS